jgi:hypothetical protein
MCTLWADLGIAIDANSLKLNPSLAAKISQVNEAHFFQH